MLKVEHIGIAVKSLEESNQLFSKLFDRPPYKTESVESEGVSTSFFQMGESKIELLEATNEDSAIAKFIAISCFWNVERNVGHAFHTACHYYILCTQHDRLRTQHH